MNSPGAVRNRSIAVSETDEELYASRLQTLDAPVLRDKILNSTINQDVFEALAYLPDSFADLIFIDPPYNLNKTFIDVAYKESTPAAYQDWLESWLPQVIAKLKDGGSLYICGDWKSAGPLQYVLFKYLKVRNRITFEREKGRGAKANWKNCSEDIWFATKGAEYYFNVEAVKMKRKVVAPYKVNGTPKDWEETEGGNFRTTSPSNLWTDITIPFWSMPENTEHPTQKPEKLLAKIMLASSKEGDLVFDPFAGSGTTAVVAKKLGRSYCGVEINKTYCLLTEKRLAMAETNPAIQGYIDGVFWERNSVPKTKILKRN